MKFVALIQACIAVVGASTLSLFNMTHQAISFGVGCSVILMSFILMGIGFSLIFKKKLVALASGIIVFKYAILGIIMFTVVKLSWFNSLWFALGVSSFVISGIIYALNEALREGKDNVI